jgi:hypothetical protein
MVQEKQLKQLVMTSLNTAQAMLDEYQLVIPFGVRAFKDSENQKMNCPAENYKKSDWQKQVTLVVNELKEFLSNENLSATALVTELESDELAGIGLQIETKESAVLFVYPFAKKDGKWVIEEPMRTTQLLSRVYS